MVILSGPRSCAFSFGCAGVVAWALGQCTPQIKATIIVLITTHNNDNHNSTNHNYTNSNNRKVWQQQRLAVCAQRPITSSCIEAGACDI